MRLSDNIRLIFRVAVRHLRERGRTRPSRFRREPTPRLFFTEMDTASMSSASSTTSGGAPDSGADELAAVLNRRQKINEALEDGKPVPPQFNRRPSVKNVFLEFKEFSRKQINEYEATFKKSVAFFFQILNPILVVVVVVDRARGSRAETMARKFSETNSVFSTSGVNFSRARTIIQILSSSAARTESFQKQIRPVFVARSRRTANPHRRDAWACRPGRPPPQKGLRLITI